MTGGGRVGCQAPELDVGGAGDVSGRVLVGLPDVEDAGVSDLWS